MFVYSEYEQPGPQANIVHSQIPVVYSERLVTCPDSCLVDTVSHFVCHHPSLKHFFTMTEQASSSSSSCSSFPSLSPPPSSSQSSQSSQSSDTTSSSPISLSQTVLTPVVVRGKGKGVEGRLPWETTNKKRKARTPQEKMMMIEYYTANKKGKTDKQMATEMNIPASTLSTILQGEEKIRQQATDGMEGFRNRQTTFPKVDEALWTWCEHVMSSKGYLSDDVLTRKALQFAEGLGIDKDAFKASNGWLQRFKERHSLKLKTLHGEATTVSVGDIDTERERLQHLISQYDQDDVYNADETALFWRMAPTKTLSNTPRSGEKVIKDRVSVMLGCNMTGMSLLLSKEASLTPTAVTYALLSFVRHTPSSTPCDQPLSEPIVFP